MTFIDWSDAEGLIGLLRDFIADERGDSAGDAARQRFLSDLLHEVIDIETRMPDAPGSAIADALEDVSTSVDRDFANDTVMVHVRDCIEQLKMTPET